MPTLIDPQDLKAHLDQGQRYQLVDVRTPEEFDAVHIPGAVNVPMDQAPHRMSEFSVGAPVVLVCHSGTRASLTCETLQSKFPNLLVLRGGTVGWKQAGLPVAGMGRVRMPIMRQVQLLVGPLIVLGAGMVLAGSPSWAILPLIIGLGLTMAGATGFCPMALAIAKCPWNRQ